MTTAPREGTTCPVCKVPTSLVPHCPSLDARCGWSKCRNKECEAVIDFVARRGHALDPLTRPAKRLNLEFLSTGEIALRRQT